ncbi:MAG: ADP-ribosylglycohydrolase family protein [Muribaculaceae bacterium]|nr:ADP-ribosylglycohydrolase family protein [Muribaculaceae bacterium]
MKTTAYLGLIASVLLAVATCGCGGNTLTMSRQELSDRMRGAWAGQVIGCTYGAPVEFRYLSRIVPDSVELTWDSTRVEYYFDTFLGQYDDVYMDITFMEVVDRMGHRAPVDSFAAAFVGKDFPLWAANQTARYNLLQGMDPHITGHWLNNPHANDIDFQIEADFAGLTAPAMPATAAALADSVGHIINYGDGFYGGAYVALMYALAFECDDVELLARRALEAIPRESSFYLCMADVLRWHSEEPSDWKAVWQLLQDKWGETEACPADALRPKNIEARINCAYVLMGLLYGQKDFARTMDIATRCGQDADCNPATACGILGAIIGYDAIPRMYTAALDAVADRPFAYSSWTFDELCRRQMEQACRAIEAEGGSVDAEAVHIRRQAVPRLPLERSFEGHRPAERIGVWRFYSHDEGLEDIELAFDGVGFVANGYVSHASDAAYEARLAVEIDSCAVDTVNLPISSGTAMDCRREELAHAFCLPDTIHTLRLRWLNPEPQARLRCSDVVVYTSSEI